MADNASVEQITVQEFVRNTAEGLFRYVHYQGRFLRSPVRRGKPHYDVVHGCKITEYDHTHYRKINVNSVLARKLLSVIH